MNQLSQLLYFGNVASHLSFFFVIFGIILAFVVAVCIGASFCYQDDAKSLRESLAYGPNAFKEAELQQKLKLARRARGLSGPGLFACFSLWLAAAFMPSQETVYAIAASEMGQRVLQSETGSLATQALNAWLKKQLAPPANDDNSK